MSASGSRGVDAGTSDGHTNIRNYAQVTQTVMFPKKEQGIILNVNENLKLSDYVTAIGNIIQPRNILFASRISNNRVCIYLTNTQLVETLTNTQNMINIKGHDIGIRRLVTPAKRLILSNVCPSIPHDILEKEIKKLGYSSASPMTFLRAGIVDPAYTHVLSFRRQIYVLPNEGIELPSSIMISHENVSYRIFLTFDVLTCFLCKNTGHTANQCPQQGIEPNITTTSQNNHDNVTPETPNNTHISYITETVDQSSQDMPLDQSTTGFKRPAPSSTISSAEPHKDTISSPASPEPEFKIPTPQDKKLKKSTSVENLVISDLLKPVEKHINEASPPYVLNYRQITDLFENLSGSKDPIGVVKTYTEDLGALLTMLQTIYPLFLHKSMKNRCTRLQKKLKKSLKLLQINDSDSDSDFSNSSQVSY